MASWPDPRVELLRAAVRTTTGADASAAARGGVGDGGEDASTRGGARANANSGLTLDDLILRRAVGGGDGGGGPRDGAANGAARGAAASGAGASGMVFSRARAPTVVTGWQNPHERRDEAARAGDGRRARVGEKTREYAEDRRLARHPTQLAGTRNAIGVVRETVDYNAGYLSPNEVNADMDGPPSPVRGFAQRLMSLEASPTPRGKHSRKRSKTQKSAEPEGAYAFEENRKRARARASATEAEALIAAARRMPASPGSDVGGPGSASRSGRALRAPGAFWASSSAAASGRGEQSQPTKRGPGRPPKNAKQYTPPTSEDEYEDFGGEDKEDDDGEYRRSNANAQRAVHRIRQGMSAVGRPRGGSAQRANGSRKGKPGPKPGAAAAKKAAMIAAGIPIPVLPPGVKRGRGRPPKSMLVIPDGPANANLSDYVLRSIAEVDPATAERVKPNRARDREYDDKPNKLRIRSPKYDHIHVEEEKTACVACGRVDGEDRMLLCDGCDRGYHTHCLVPRLDKVPENEWFCYECVSHNRPKTAAAEAFERRKAAKAPKTTYEAYDECEEYDKDGQRLSDKFKLNGERKRKPGPKPGSRNKLTRRYSDGSRDDHRRDPVDDPDTIEKRPVGRPRKDPNAWSDEQLEALQNAQVRVDLGRKNFWTEVASYVPGKSARECQAKVYAGLNLGDVDGDERPAEDDAAAEEAQDDDDDLSEDDRDFPRERTLRTPTKPNSSRENIDRWRHRAHAPPA